MKLKTRLYFAFGFLFLLIVLLSGLGSIFVRQLADDSKSIIQDNYRTLDYMQQIKSSLDVLIANSDNQDIIGKNKVDTSMETIRESLSQQMENVTEPGEDKLSKEFERGFLLLQKLLEESINNENSDPSEIISQASNLQDLASKIYELNIQTLLKKNDTANETAERVILYMSITGVTGSILSLIFIIGFPEVIFDPLQKLNIGIKAIAAKKYDHQLPENEGNELGEIAKSFNSMAVKLKEYEASNYVMLFSEKKRIDAIINQMHEGIIGIDENQRLLFVNDYAKSLFNLGEDIKKGEHIQTIAQKIDFFASFAVDFALGGNESLKPKIVKIIHNGKELTFSREIIPINAPKYENQQPINIGYVVVISDITDFSDKDKAKTQFIATISHELKTPISSIGLGIKLLSDNRTGELNDEQKKLLDGLKDDKNRLLSITSELLDITQAETGNIILEKEAFDPSEVISDAVNALLLQAKDKSIKILTSVESNNPVLGDSNKVTWVLVNLLSNAIRYSKENSEIQLVCKEHFGENLKFEVIDQGKGIPSEFKEKLFEKYYRVPGNKNNGSGLGLAISKEFISAMEGQIGVKSQEGKGSVFWFTLKKS